MDTVGNIQYVYQKKRSKFGRPFLLHDEVPNTLNIFPDKSLFDDYILKNPVEQASQCGPVFARCEVNTVRAEYTQHGMNHTEGGWPRDVNPADEEQAIRYRKKVEKDDMYLHALSQLSHSMEHYILQNNALNLYEVYFEDVEETAVPERGSARTVNVYRDPSSVKRPVTYLSWSPDGGSKVAVTHCNLEFQRAPADLSTHSYIWDVENPNKPQMTLKPTVPLASLEYNPKDPNVLVSGMFSGQVAFWDTRRLPSPAEVSALEPSHRDPVHSVLWLSSKSGTEFFSATTDGLVKWWDTRKISEPSETLILDVVKAGEEQDLSRAVGASVLEYEPTIPIRFMVGTENGSVISCNRKGKTPAEKMIAKYSAHVGPVYALQRNPSFVKNFLTIGDWTARIWSEDCKDSAIMWTSNHRHRLTYGAWSPVRTSVFYTTRTDGSLDVWDILQQQREALLTFKIVCGDLIHLNQATVSRIIKVTSNELAGHLLQYAHFPGPGGIRSNQRKFYDLGEFPGVTGCIDCTHICISNPGGQFPELYRNRKQYMSLNVQVVAGPNLEIMDIVTRWPGSTHDARIFSNSRVMVRFENQGLPGILLGDNGYPQLPFLYTPVLVPTTAAEIRYNLAHRRTRNIVERLFGVWKRRFACLGQKLRTKLATSNKVILACAVLHNIAVQHEEPLPPPVEELRVLPIVPVANLRPRNHRGAAMRAMFIERHFV